MMATLLGKNFKTYLHSFENGGNFQFSVSNYTMAMEAKSK